MAVSSHKPTVHIVAAANAGFNMPLCVMLTSVVIHFDPERPLAIYALSLDSGPKEQENLRLSLEKNRPGLKNIEIHWPTMNPAWFENLPKNNRFGLDTFSRLFAPQILPPECEKFIYLDCDMIVVTDISPLHDDTNNGTALYAVLDFGSPWASTPDGVFNHVELGMPANAHMFNAGLLVVDLKKWREQDITTPVLDYARRHAGVSFNDQSALNAVLYGNWTELDPRWNQCHEGLLFEKWKALGLSREEWMRSCEDPFIIHYSGLSKPWQGRDWKPRYKRFFDYLDRTVFSGTIQQKTRIENQLGFRNYLYWWLFLRFNYRLLKRFRQLFQGNAS